MHIYADDAAPLLPKGTILHFLTGAPQGPPRLALVWSLFRGPGGVIFDNAKPANDHDHGGQATTTFAAPGDYVLRLQASGSTGDGGSGFQCYWTNVHVGVTVTSPRATALQGR